MAWPVNIARWAKRRLAPLPYDAADHPAELYYASLYLEYLDRHLGQLAATRPLKILDAGCGTGRFLIPLAQRGHNMVGIDYHRASVRRLKEKLAELGLEAMIHDADLAKAAARIDDGGFDAALAIEALYTHPDLEGIVHELCRVVRPGGILMVTHRPRFYYIAQCLAQGNFDDALIVSRQSAGRLRKGHHRIHYNWQSEREIDDLYRRLGCAITAKYAIGPYSGFAPDPMAAVCDPGSLGPRERAKLRELERCADPETRMASRYVLIVARKQDR